MLRSFLFLAFAFAAMLVAPRADADDVEQARELFRQGSSLARDAQWGAALASFERSAKLRPSAGTTYNIGVCERALGQYVRARRTFQRALEDKQADPTLPESAAADIRRFLAEIEGLLGSIDVSISPADASIAVDGAPLELLGPSADALLAGTLPAGPGSAAPRARFRVIVDPGAHVFVVSHAGFNDGVQPITVRPGEKAQLELAAARRSATLHVSADRPDSVVTVNMLDVGVAPVELSRPAGKYHVLVRHPGFVPYEVDAALEPGQRTELRASLKPEQTSLLKKWWFWTAAAVVVTGATIATYAATRPDPQRPPVDGGGMQWAVRAP